MVVEWVVELLVLVVEWVAKLLVVVVDVANELVVDVVEWVVELLFDVVVKQNGVIVFTFSFKEKDVIKLNSENGLRMI